MSTIHAIFLGIVQGLTEFLPISSTAHVTISGKLLGLVDPARPQEWTAFIAIIQLGTVAAVIVYFMEDLRGILRDVRADVRLKTSMAAWSPNSRLALHIVLGTIPVVVFGLGFKDVIEGHFTKTPSVIAASLIGLALFLWWSEKVGKKTRSQDETTWKDALIVGLAQALALIPGSSRSGTTITAGLFLGLRRESAARYSFLLSIPAVLGSGLYELYSIRQSLSMVTGVPLVIATLVSGVVGYATIAFLLRYLRTHTTHIFIFYRIVLGLFIWALVLGGSI